MSNRAEGCGQWLSAKAKRATTQVVALRAKKEKKKKKGLLNFASKVPTSGLNMYVSSSPLSPRTRKKLKNAKQSKIDDFFKEKVLPNGSASNNKVKLKGEGSLEGKLIKVPVKRHRDEDSSSGYSREDRQSNEHIYMYSQEKEISDSTDLNISGISCLDDSYHCCKEFSENDLQPESETNKNRDSLRTCTLSPPSKKLCTSQSGPSLTGEESKEINNVHTALESDPSQSFQYSQWKRDQISKCREVEGRSLIEDGTFADANCLIVDKEESDLTINESNLAGEFSETPPFQFTQWVNQQVKMCHKIEKETDVADIVLQRSLKSVEQSGRLKVTSRERYTSSAPKFTDQSHSEFDFTEWAEYQMQLCRKFSDTQDTGSTDWESGEWGEWMCKTEKTDSCSLFSDE